MDTNSHESNLRWSPSTFMEQDLRCQCNLPPKLYTSRKQPDNPRQFLRCPKAFNEQCKFFEWVDELPVSLHNVGQNIPPTPQSARPSTSRQPEPPSTPTPSRTIKRPFGDIEDEADTSSSPDKRFRIIEDALKEQKAPQTPQRNTYGSSSFRALSASPPLPPTPGKFRPSTGRPVASTTPHFEAPPSSQETISGEDPQELNADAVAEMVKSLGGLPDYIRKLERKRIAAEKSRDAKATKINHLELEVERLKRREKELEEVIVHLESS